MQFYDIVEIKKEYTEHFSIITVTKMDCVLRDTSTNDIVNATVTFYQLVDLHDAKKYMKIKTTDKIKVEIKN